jgi:HSP20 family protein
MSALTIRNNNNYGVNILDDLFGSWGDIFSNHQPTSVRDLHTPTVRELEDRFEISVAAPGLEKKDFNISIEGNRLTVGYDATDKPERYAYATKYSKSYTVPHTCDAEKIQASYKSGVLVVELPKGESAKMRQIKIK